MCTRVSPHFWFKKFRSYLNTHLYDSPCSDYCCAVGSHCTYLLRAVTLRTSFMEFVIH